MIRRMRVLSRFSDKSLKQGVRGVESSDPFRAFLFVRRL